MSPRRFDRRRFLATSAAAATAAVVGPYVHTSRAAGSLAVGFWDHWVPGANDEPIGPEGSDVLAPRYFNGRKMTIYGGSSEVQRGIMAKAMLGL